MATSELKLFSGNANSELARRICDHLGIQPGNASVGSFPDGELNIRFNDDVRGADVFLVQPTSPPVNDNLMELLVMIDACKRASANRITAVLPYYGYARKDRKDEGRVPITAKLVASLLTTAGADRVLALDLHAAQIQGFFDIPVDHLLALPVFANHFRESGFGNENVVFAAPDVGSVKMARAFSKALHSRLALVDKVRTSPDKIEVAMVIGDVKGFDVMLVDDMITTAGSMTAAARALVDKGARSVRACAVHGIFCPPAVERLVDSPIEEIIVTDSISFSGRVEQLGDRLKVLSVSELLAEAIQRIHLNLSVSALFAGLPKE